jgi:acyl carrier protein
MEERMTRLWEVVFGREVGDNEDFFLDLGGDSLQAVQLIDLVVTEFGVPASVADLFELSTPAELLSAVREPQAGRQ